MGTHQTQGEEAVHAQLLSLSSGWTQSLEYRSHHIMERDRKMSGPRGLQLFHGHTAGPVMIVDSWPGQELSQPFTSPRKAGSAEAGNG